MRQLCYYRDSRRVRYDTPDGAVEICTPVCGRLPEGPAAAYGLHAVLGILRLREGAYLLFVAESEPVGAADHGGVHRILEVQFVSLSGPDTCQEVEGIKALIEDNCFYYSFGAQDKEFVWNCRLMEVFEACCVGGAARGGQRGSGAPPFCGAGARLARRRVKLKDVIDSSTHLERQLGVELFVQEEVAVAHGPATGGASIEIRHASPSGRDYMAAEMFCGYFETQTHLADASYALTIRSRISNRKIGTRLLSRGVDEDGNVSFFVETSFCVSGGGRREVFTIARGSVPLFWSQDDPLRPRRVQMDRGAAEARGALVRHFEALRHRYGQVVVLDLLGHRKYERMLSRLYEEACRDEGMPYLHFDLNRNTGDFDVLKERLHAKIRELQEAARCGEVVFRVNCLDCLDRTNLVQFLIFSHLYPSYRFGAVRQMWRHNGDALSNFYTGSDALKAELATKGRQSVIGRMNDLIISANRMINNKFSDQEKQRYIDLLLGHTSQ